MEGYIGEVKMFAGNYAPENWAFCAGQVMQISEYQSLYALIGIQFGGDGRATFNLPDLRGRVPVGSGSGPGLSQRIQGTIGGSEKVTLVVNNLPAHGHNVSCGNTNTSRDISDDPTNMVPAKTDGGKVYGTAKDKQMAVDMIVNTGGNVAHENMQPWGCLNYIICLTGIWPPRP